MAQAASAESAPRGWATLRLLTPYHWLVFIICCAAWDLDCMDQQLFVLAREPALAMLTDRPLNDPSVRELAANATAVFMIGWAIGGIAFGILGDRLGRVKTLSLTIGLYALFTGFSALSVGPTDFMVYRLLTGLGVGGAFASAVVLLAETVPEPSRPYVIGLFQASSVLGNCAAALIGMQLGSMQKAGAFEASWFQPWRIMFLIGLLPGLLFVAVQLLLREPERWLAIRAAESVGKRPSPWVMYFGTLRDLITTPPWARRAIFGLLLTSAGVIGLWGIGFFSPQLVSVALEGSLRADGFDGPALAGEIGRWKGITSLFQNAGAFLGMFAFAWVTGWIGRKPAFTIFFILAAAATALTFSQLQTREDIYWMIPLMGFCQLAVFGGYAIYLPELFPTRLRSTGTSFCYNAGRLLAASGPSALALLTSVVFASQGNDAIRYAGVSMCAVFVIGIMALPFLPETNGQPLPEEPSQA